jgi:V8-like Glu-specific endopeptidase
MTRSTTTTVLRLGLVTTLFFPPLAAGAIDDEAQVSPGDLNHPMRPLGELVPYREDSGRLVHRGSGFEVVYSATVRLEGARWLRLYFDAAELPNGSFVRVTAPFDGETQDLDAATMRMWSNSTAYFNGEMVFVDLIAAPGGEPARVSIHQVGAQIGDERQCGADCGICGADDRLPSTENWAGRLMPVGCSATVWSQRSCLVSAGHCMQSGLVIQFNVPDSNSNCSTNNPPVAEQFPIITYQYQNGGVGADWAVLTTGPNGLGQTCYERYGLFRPIATALGNPGNPVTVNGYGVDDDQPTRSQTQQLSTGTINSRFSTYYSFTVDITYGNSGSSLCRNAEVIGIVSHCTTNCPNYATRVDLASFANARNALCPPCTMPEFTQQPASQNVCSGVTVQMTVVVNNIPNPSYQWRIGTNNLVNDGVHVFGATTSTLTLVNVTPADSNGFYNCLVTNLDDDCARQSNNAYLYVYPAASITSQPQDRTIMESENADFHVTATGNPPLTYRWRRNGADLSNGGNIYGATTPNLYIAGATADQAGWYECRVTDACGAVLSNAAHLVINTGAGAGRGDLNCDGLVDFDDINPFVLALSLGETEYYNQYPNCHFYNADTDSNGTVDFDDINTFVACLSAGGCP